MIGMGIAYMGINDLFLDTVNIPRRGREIFEWLNAAFGTTHSDDYFSIAVGIYFIYYGLFKIEINKNIS